MKISIIGIGMGNCETLTVLAREKMNNCDVLIGAKRILDTFSQLQATKFAEISPIKIEQIIRQNCDKKIVVVMSGDTGFYSGTKKLVERISDLEYEVLPGISSVSYMASKICRSWQDVNIVSAHGVDCNILGNILLKKESFFLLDGTNSANFIINLLCENNLGNSTVYVGEDLSYDTEKITCDSATNLQNRDFAKLAVIWIVRPEIFGDTNKKILDSDFIRAKVPMTKGEVRSVICDFFDIKDGDTIFDIGAGTGSVAVKFATDNVLVKVKAVEINHEATELIFKNREKFNAYNVEVFEGEATQKLHDMGTPDDVFIGGSKGNLRQIIDIILGKNPNCAILVSAVTLETFNECVAIFEKYFKNEYEICQINVSKTKKVGNYNMFQAENPIFLIGRR